VELELSRSSVLEERCCYISRSMRFRIDELLVLAVRTSAFVAGSFSWKKLRFDLGQYSPVADQCSARHNRDTQA
jgi:hypothetical protein